MLCLKPYLIAILGIGAMKGVGILLGIRSAHVFNTNDYILTAIQFLIMHVIIHTSKMATIEAIKRILESDQSGSTRLKRPLDRILSKLRF